MSTGSPIKEPQRDFQCPHCGAWESEGGYADAGKCAEALARLDEARARLLKHFEHQPEISAAIYRDLLGASRKFAIALLDFFDHSGVTTRVGDMRRLRSSGG